jgi:hypothetical protein
MPVIMASEDPAQQPDEPAAATVVFATGIATTAVTIIVVTVTVGFALVVVAITVVVAPIPPMRRDFVAALVLVVLSAGVQRRHSNKGQDQQ